MHNSIKIQTGIKLAINDNPDRVIAFDPEDINFINNFYNLVGELEEKEKEYSERASRLNSDEMDERGIPKNTKEVLNLVKESCEYLKEKIDEVFGEDTSEKVFGKALSLSMFEQFFEGITPFIQERRNEKIEKYTRNRAQRRASGKKVMK